MRPRYPTYLTSYSAYLPWVMQWADVGLRGAIDDALNLKPHVWPFGRCLVDGYEVGFPMQVFVSPDDDRRAGVRAP